MPVDSALIRRTEKKKCLPSGRNEGHRCENSRSCALILVTGSGLPPVASTRQSGPDGAEEKMITPCRPHVPPRPFTPSQITCGGPPPTSMRFNFPFEKKATDWLSGDQNIDREASSLPSRIL